MATTLTIFLILTSKLSSLANPSESSSTPFSIPAKKESGNEKNAYGMCNLGYKEGGGHQLMDCIQLKPNNEDKCN